MGRAREGCTVSKVWGLGVGIGILELPWLLMEGTDVIEEGMNVRGPGKRGPFPNPTVMNDAPFQTLR